MARKVTTDDIKQFNELYVQHKSYAAVARITGWSASTVSKYIDKNYQPIVTENIERFDMARMPEFDSSALEFANNFGDLCSLSDEEQKQIEKLWKELAI